MKYYRTGETHALQIYNKQSHHVDSWFVQLTLKEPFWYPHVEERFDNGSWIAGWLFVYFGKIISRQKGD